MHHERFCSGSCADDDARETPSKERFRARFQKALQVCLRRRFSLEESFGLIFAETLNEIPVSLEEETQLFAELLSWARQSGQLFPCHSPQVSVGNGR
jgi:hypothetical protein